MTKPLQKEDMHVVARENRDHLNTNKRLEIMFAANPPHN